MENQSNELINGQMRSAILKFALPFMFASFLQSVYGAVDLFVVGQYADSAAVSAVSIGSQLMQLITMVVNGLAMGGTVEIGLRIGEKNDKGVCRAVGNITVIFCVLALLLTPVMLLLVNQMVSVMQTPSEAVPDCRRYMLVCCAGLPFIIGYNAVSGIYRGIGDSKTPVRFVGIACVINIILDFLLTGYLKMGAIGAAYATTFSQGVSFLIALVHMKRGGFNFSLSKDDFKPNLKITKRILVVGFPLAMQDALVHFSFLAISAIINTLGLIASAAVGVSEKLMGFAFLIPAAFGSAIATAVAQNIGAGKLDRPKEALKWGIIYSVACGTAVFLLCVIIPGVLIGIFSNDESVIRAGATYITSYSMDCILTGFVFCINGFLNGNGKSLVCFAHSMAATFLVRIPATWLLSKVSSEMKLFPMGLAAPAASILSIVICVIYFYACRKKKNTEVISNE